MPEYIDLQYRRDGAVAWITLDRPEARNAYSEAMIESLLAAIDAADEDEAVRAVVITGAGRGFCAGGDLKRMHGQSGMFQGDSATLRRRYAALIQRIPRRLERFDKPIIAAINGAAIGAGLDLACMCDFRLAAEGARFGSTFVKVGLIPGDGGAFVLQRVVGFAAALDLMLTARVIATSEAQRLGLVGEVLSPEALLPRAAELAEHLASLPPVALQLAKRAAYQAYQSDLARSLELAATYQGITQRTEDHHEAVAALLAKRAPTFTGR